MLIDGPDGYYHLRRALLILAHWPGVPQRDVFLGPPAGGLIAWPPLFDLTLAALAKVYPAPLEAALEAVGARLPVLFGVAQVLLVAALARRLGGSQAAIAAAFLAAVLPAAVRFTLLGALDHDPAVEALALVVLLALARVLPGAEGEGSASGPAGKRRVAAAVLLAAFGLAALPLTWSGSELHLGLVGLALVGAVVAGGWVGAATAGAVLVCGSLAAAAVVAPFAATSAWSSLDAASFAGLSWLHVATLAALGAGGAVVALAGRAALSASERRIALAAGALAALGLVALLPRMLAPLAAGLSFVGGDDPFLAAVAESRPLLFLFGPFDPRPALVRLSALPLLLPPLLLARWRPRRDARLGLLVAWLAVALTLALLQARYSHAAAMAVAVAGGAAWQTARSRRERALLVAALLPCLPAFLPVPGFGGLRLYGRPNDVVTSGMAEVTAYLAAAAPPPAAWSDPRAEADGAVLAPWSYGHWIHWRARRPTIANPFGP